VRRNASIVDQRLRTLVAQNLKHGATTDQRRTCSGTVPRRNGSDGSCSETVTLHSAFRRHPRWDTSSLPGGRLCSAINLARARPILRHSACALATQCGVLQGGRGGLILPRCGLLYRLGISAPYPQKWGFFLHSQERRLGPITVKQSAGALFAQTQCLGQPTTSAFRVRADIKIR